MNIEGIKGYIEGMDITQIPLNYLAYPSKNVIVYKGTAFSRPGIKNDGTEKTTDDQNVIGEFVWKDALGGERALRAIKGGNIQLKYLGKWITIGAVANTTGLRVRFATWIDDEGNIIKKRLFFVDGSDKMYEWNGAIGVIASADSGAQTLTTGGTGTLEQIGFDPGNVSATPVRVVRFSSPGVVAGTDNYTSDSDMQTLVVHTVEAITNVPVAGDIVVGAIIEHDDILAGINKDDIYTYKNKLAVANFDSIRVYYSNTEIKLDYVVPSVGSRTAISPFFIDLAGNYTAMISRYNQATDETICWVSDVDGWTKITALVDQDSFGNWVKTNRVAASERTGALPMAVADYKGDIIFMAQDRTLQRIESVDVLGKDTLRLISDKVEGLLRRVDVTEVRLYYFSRYVSIVLPASSMLVLLDMVEGEFLPPQDLPISHISIIDGIQYGHSNVRDETFELFTGRSDLGAKFQSVFAWGYYAGNSKVNPMRHKKHTIIGISGRLTVPTIATVEQFFETDGSKAKDTFLLDGSKIKSFTIGTDFSWATQIWGGSSIGGADSDAVELKRFFAYSKYDAVPWLEWSPKITVNGENQEFHLLGLWIDDDQSAGIIPADLFIERPTT